MCLGEDSINKRILAIKSIDDYDENVELVKELKDLRRKLCVLKSKSSNTAVDPTHLIQLETRIKEIKTVDDYDENEDLVKELKHLRAQVRYDTSLSVHFDHFLQFNTTT